MSFVQPSKEVEARKKVSHPPFYVSLIIGDKLFHNCMIDSGSSTSLMRRCIANALEMELDPIVRDVL